MTRVYNVTYAVHVQHQPDPVDSPTKAEPTRKIEQEALDFWRTESKVVAVVDGDAEDAIEKAKALIEAKGEKGVSEVSILGVVLQNEAE